MTFTERPERRKTLLMQRHEEKKKPPEIQLIEAASHRYERKGKTIVVVNVHLWSKLIDDEIVGRGNETTTTAMLEYFTNDGSERSDRFSQWLLLSTRVGETKWEKSNDRILYRSDRIINTRREIRRSFEPRRNVTVKELVVINHHQKHTSTTNLLL